jgi:hypothetical protein
MDARLMSRPTRRVRQLLPLNPDYQSGTGTDNGADGIDYPSGPYKPILTPFGVPAVTYGTPAEGTDLTAIRTDAVLAPPEVDELANIDTTGKADGDVIYWDAGSSTWLVAAPSGGGGVTVQDEGSPLTTTATTLDFVGAGVTATGAGATKTITIPGGGGGTDYDVSPNPTGDDDEFKAALSGWTTLGSLNDSNTSDLYGHLHLRKATVGLQLHGVYKAAPSMPFTATIKLSDYSIRRGNYTNFGLAVGDATPTAWCSFTLGTFNNAVIRDTWTNNTTRASTANGTNDDAREHPNYLRIVVNSSTSIDCWISTDGLVWTRELSGVNPGFTVSKIGIVVQANGQEADSYFDWIRFGSSVVQSPSRLIGGGAGVTVQDEGTPLTTTATTLDFVGAGVTATGAGATKTITIPGGSGIVVQDEGSPLTTDATTLDFVGAGVTATGSGATKTITIPGASASGALVLLAEQVASASATLDFTTRTAPGQSGAIIQTDFDEYLIEFLNCVPATNATSFRLRTSTNGGSSYDSTANDYHWSGHVTVQNADGNVGSNTDTAIQLAGSISNTTASGGTSGSFRLVNPLGTTHHKMVHGKALNNSTSNAGLLMVQDMAGARVSTADVDALRFMMASGNITSGVVRIYGIAK